MGNEILLAILLTATLSDLLLPFFISRRYPGYSHLTDTISTLGTKISPARRYGCDSLIFSGCLFFIFGTGQYFFFEQTTWLHKMYTAGIIVFAIGSVLAGIFPEDPRGTEETPSGKIHGISSGIGFIFLILNPLWAVWIVEFYQMQVINIILFILGLVTFIFFLMSENKTRGILRFTGLFQRLNLIVLNAVLILNFLNL